MQVKVRSVGAIRQVLGAAELPVAVPEGTTLSGLLARLGDDIEGFAPYAVKAQEASSYAPLRIVVNGRDVVPVQRQQLVLRDGDDVLVLLPIAGG